MKKYLTSTTSLLLLSTPYCYAQRFTHEEANNIIVTLVIIIVALVVLGCYGIYYHRIISRRNEQMQRILTVLNEYRDMVGDKVIASDKQEEDFSVIMDARVNKEHPFTDPDFDHDALVKFMGVDDATFCKLVPRYTEPARTLDYINSLRAEYAAKLLMEHPDYSANDLASKCGFRNTAAYTSAFKFAFGITPTDYLTSMNQMFKKAHRG